MKKKIKGKVLSNKMEKSIVVKVDRMIKYPIYGKFVKRKTKLYAHDEYNECNIGDLVEIFETKPISKKKHWKLFKIIKKKSLQKKLKK